MASGSNSIRYFSAHSLFPLFALVFMMYAWPPSAAAGAPGDDLSVTFSGDKGAEPGGIAGTVTNSSGRDYECVDLGGTKDASVDPAAQGG